MSLAKVNRLGVLCGTLPSRCALRAVCSIHMTADQIFSKNAIKHTNFKGSLDQWVCYSTSNDSISISSEASKEGHSNNNDQTEIEISSIQTHESQQNDGTLETSIRVNANQNDNDLHSKNPVTHKKLPEPPVYCCGTGCGKCVWMIYAEELKDYYQDDLGKIKEGLNLDQIEDPSVRMFVKMELGL